MNWIIKTHIDFSLKDETFLLSLNLFDRCINRLTSSNWQLFASACMRIASKYEEILINELSDYQRVTGGRYSKADINQAELLVIETVQFSISQTCHTTVFERIRILQGLKDSFSKVAIFLCKIAQVEAKTASQNQYILSIAIGCLVSERVFHKPIDLSTMKALFLLPDQVEPIISLIQEAIRWSLQEPLNPARRELVQIFGAGQVKKMEDLLLQ